MVSVFLHSLSACIIVVQSRRGALWSILIQCQIFLSALPGRFHLLIDLCVYYIFFSLLCSALDVVQMFILAFTSNFSIPIEIAVGRVTFDVQVFLFELPCDTSTNNNRKKKIIMKKTIIGEAEENQNSQ